MRQGLWPAGRSALLGGVLLALIQGAGLTLIQLLVRNNRSRHVELECSYASSSSWFGGLFGGRREEEKPKLKVEVLESFDSLMPPTFEFQ
ncbi:hypothetical protein HanXRQr2_Chr09g0380031 [Helianthus annuus]|uniref:Putative inner membrane translocase complex, subunit Tim17 n=1 Tax=Helianthus annuus TaxID=4232 RepID=A0A251TWW1_HELAN|nr:mitochondrial import inner membrane translocase subunit TIM17-1 [Helianthus annuus]KAF5790175.1 hypothetical protein HanXRQr2_Chr09g0380031 [Helianthus annuus]